MDAACFHGSRVRCVRVHAGLPSGLETIIRDQRILADGTIARMLQTTTPVSRAWEVNAEAAKILHKLSCFKQFLGPGKAHDAFFIRVCATMERVSARGVPRGPDDEGDAAGEDHAAVLSRFAAVLKVTDIDDFMASGAADAGADDDDEAAPAERRVPSVALGPADGRGGDSVSLRSIAGLQNFRRVWPVAGPASAARDLSGLLHPFLVLRGHITTAILDSRNQPFAFVTYQVGQCCFALTPVRHRVVDFSPDVELAMINYWVMMAFTGTHAGLLA
jgi:hypothetical protein